MATFLAIQSPQPPTQCVPTTFRWDGGTPPYSLSITSVNAFGIGDTLQRYSNITEKSLVWPVDLTGGTVFGVVLSDSSRPSSFTVQYEPVTVLAGPDSSCLEASSSSSSMSSSATLPPQTLSPSGSTIPESMPTTSSTSSDGGATESSSSTTSESASVSQTTGPTSSPTPGVSDSLGSGAIAGIAIGAAAGGILLAALFYWLWRRLRSHRIRGERTLDLNESTLAPTQAPASSKAAMMRQPLLSSNSPLSSPSPTAASFAQYPSGISGVYLNEIYRTPYSPSASANPSASGAVTPEARLSAVDYTKGGVKSWEIQPLSPSFAGWDASGSGAAARGSVQESDAGVRLAGGLPRIEVSEGTDRDDGGQGGSTTVPPPYQRYED